MWVCMVHGNIQERRRPRARDGGFAGPGSALCPPKGAEVPAGGGPAERGWRRRTAGHGVPWASRSCRTSGFSSAEPRQGPRRFLPGTFGDAAFPCLDFPRQAPCLQRENPSVFLHREGYEQYGANLPGIFSSPPRQPQGGRPGTQGPSQRGRKDRPGGGRSCPAPAASRKP